MTLWDSLGGVSGAWVGGNVRLTAGLVPALGGVALPPTIQQVLTVDAGQSASGELPTADPDGDPLVWSVVTTPKRGTLTITGGMYTFQAAATAGGTESLTLQAVDGQGNRTVGTLTVTVRAVQTAVRAWAPTLTAPYQVNVEAPWMLIVVGGTPPYTVTSSLERVAVLSTFSNLDVDKDGQLDRGQTLRLTAISAGSDTVVVQDAVGATTQLDVAVVAPLPSRPPAPPPPIPTSSRSQTLFGALGPQTPQGARSLMGAFRAASATEAVGYTWDASTQGFVQLPQEPAGGLTAMQGVFVASRVSLNVDFTGTPAAVGSAWTLAPGWNFVAVPLLVNGSQGPIAQVDPATDLTLMEMDGTELTGTDRVAAFSGNWWSFDGQNYQAESSLAPGKAYWIRNRSSPARPLSLAITPGVGARFAQRAAEGSRPPAPPQAASSSAAPEPHGGCGAGGGVAVLVGALAIAGWRRRR